MPIAIPQPDTGSSDYEGHGIKISSNTPLDIRAARVNDVHGMSALINQYAANNVMLARGPQYLYQHIQDYVVIAVPDEDENETVIACGALHVLWEDLAEIRSIAVHRNCQKMGLGKKLVNFLVERCQALGIPRVFVFTLVDKFFMKCGFEEFRREELPPIVWVECSKCPKFYKCDEIGMIKQLS